MKAILLIASGLLIVAHRGLASGQNAKLPPQDTVERRIESVVHGLLPATAFTDRFAPKASLKDRMAFYHTPGVSVAVINDYRIDWARGFGVKEFGKRDPVTATTLFQAGSISKPIFALAVMQLVQQGKLNLDENVNHYLTSWKVPPSGSWQPRITLRELLSHSAGFTVHGFLGYEASDKLPTIVDVLEGRLPADTPPVIVTLLPGTQFRYSGGGITVAQLVVTDALRKPFPEIMRQLVLDPLGMKHSTYEQPLPRSWQSSAATSHPWKNHPLPGKWYIHPELAAAGLWTTPSDLARALLEVQLAFQGKSNRFLSVSKAAEMITPINDRPVGIGFFAWDKGEAAAFGHNGKNEGAEAIMSAYKNTGKGAVIMINANEGFPLLGEIQRSIARAYDWPGYFDEDKKPALISSNVLASCVGRYATKAGLKFSVANQNGTLFLKCGDQAPIELRPISETKFSIPILNDAEVTFSKTDKGEVNGLNLSQEGTQVSAERER